MLKLSDKSREVQMGGIGSSIRLYCFVESQGCSLSSSG